ncbi:MAG TPA: hypothetical protein VFI09_08160 [Solirubrobacterales bacterium]|nr:hypothetical protein [Solirubrobacterales bacterium]
MIDDSHPIRTAILNAFASGRALLLPHEFARATGHTLGRIAYHFRVLEESGRIETAAQLQMGATVARVYRTVPGGAR